MSLSAEGGGTVIVSIAGSRGEHRYQGTVDMCMGRRGQRHFLFCGL